MDSRRARPATFQCSPSDHNIADASLDRPTMNSQNANPTPASQRVRGRGLDVRPDRYFAVVFAGPGADRRPRLDSRPHVAVDSGVPGSWAWPAWPTLPAAGDSTAISPALYSCLRRLTWCLPVFTRYRSLQLPCSMPCPFWSFSRSLPKSLSASIAPTISCAGFSDCGPGGRFLRHRTQTR